MADRTGQQLGHYRLVRLLGRGGFAEVYLGEHLRLKTQAAIKVLYTALEEDDIEGFLREAQTVARLKHPHIVRVFDFDVQDHTPYLVMDYLPNGSIRRLYPKGSVLPLPAVVSYVTQIASALQYAHDEKVIHRDVKPENMLLDRDNSLVLSDFGIALMAQSSRYQSAQEVAGTAAYMAPEQFQGHPHRASDQYALGVVVYEWLTGNRPFHGTFSEIASQHMFVPPPPLPEKVPDISPDIEQVVRTALEKDPKQRFGSILAFATALEQASQVKQPEPKPGDLISQTTETNQSQQPTKLATTLPAMPLSQRIVSESSANLPAQPQMITPLSGKEYLGQAAEDRHQAEKETTHQENKQADKLEEKRVHQAKETVLALTELTTAAHQTPLPQQTRETPPTSFSSPHLGVVHKDVELPAPIISVNDSIPVPAPPVSDPISSPSVLESFSKPEAPSALLMSTNALGSASSLVDQSHVHSPILSFWPIILAAAILFFMIGLLIAAYTPWVSIIAFLIMFSSIIGFALENPKALRK